MREQIFKEHMKTIRGYVAADKGLTEEQERIRSDVNDNRTGPAEEREDGARKRRAEGGGVGDRDSKRHDLGGGRGRDGGAGGMGPGAGRTTGGDYLEERHSRHSRAHDEQRGRDSDREGREGVRESRREYGRVFDQMLAEVCGACMLLRRHARARAHTHTHKHTRTLKNACDRL